MREYIKYSLIVVYIAKDVSAGAHNHKKDFFLEVHLSLSTGTRDGGMWRVKPGTTIPPNPDDLPPEAYEKLPLSSLEEHGGFWDQERDGMPAYREDGSIQYPYHKWQAGDDGDNIDVWAVFELNPKLVEDY